MLDLQNKLDRERMSQQAQSPNNMPTPDNSEPKRIEQAKTKRSWIRGFLLFVFILLILSSNSWLFYITQNHTSNTQDLILRLNQIEYTLKENEVYVKSVLAGLKDINSELEKIALGLEATNKKISKIENVNENINLEVTQLQKDIDVNYFAIENLNKAKNSLFSKTNELVIKIDELSSNIQKGSSYDEQFAY